MDGSPEGTIRGDRACRVATKLGTTNLTLEAGGWLLALHGEHDLTTVSALEHQMQHVRSASTNVVIDLSDAAFIDCAIAGWLAHWAESAQNVGDLHLAVVVGPDGTIAHRVCDLLSIDRIVPCRDTRERALRVVEGGL